MRPSAISSTKRALLALLIPGLTMLTGCGMSMTQSLSTMQLLSLLSSMQAGAGAASPCARTGTCPKGSPCAQAGGTCPGGTCPLRAPAPRRAELVPGGDDPLIDEEQPEDPARVYPDLGGYSAGYGDGYTDGWDDGYVQRDQDVEDVAGAYDPAALGQDGLDTAEDRVGVEGERPLPGLGTWANDFNLDLDAAASGGADPVERLAF